MKKLFLCEKIILTVLIALSFCAMAPAMAQEDGVGVFMALRLPQQETGSYGSDDSALGSFTADALRVQTGADFAMIGAGELDQMLEQGWQEYSDVKAVFRSDEPVMLVPVTPARLSAVLETLVSQVTVDLSSERIDRTASVNDWFPSLSGFTLTYDAAAPAGERVYALALEDGTPLDPKDDARVYTLAVSQAMMAELGLEGEAAGVSLSRTLYDYLAACGADLDGLDWDRVTAIGAHDNEIADIFPSGVLLAVCILVPVLCMIWINRRRPT